MPESSELTAELFERVKALPAPKVPAIRPIRRELTRRLSGGDPGSLLALAEEIIDRSLNFAAVDLRWVACELVHYHPAALRSLDREDLERLGAGLNSWDSVDTFSLNLSGPAWRSGQIADSDLHLWAAAADRWWRRAALVSTVALNNRARGGRGDVERTRSVCRLLVADRDDMVVKAMSWALRELVKHDAAAVAGFLAEHDHTLAARVKREVRNKLNTGVKNPGISNRANESPSG